MMVPKFTLAKQNELLEALVAMAFAGSYQHMVGNIATNFHDWVVEIFMFDCY